MLRDKLHRRIRRYYAFLSSTTETRPVTANIHLICSPAGEDEYRDDDGTLIASKQAWAEVTRGAFHRHEGHGDHGAMLLEPYYRANAALLGAILTSARAPATASATP